MHQMNCVAAAAAVGKPMMENPAKHLVYRPTAMQLLSILTTTMEVMPKVSCGRPAMKYVLSRELLAHQSAPPAQDVCLITLLLDCCVDSPERCS
jgi:hypothetical protein